MDDATRKQVRDERETAWRLLAHGVGKRLEDFVALKQGLQQVAQAKGPEEAKAKLLALVAILPGAWCGVLAFAAELGIAEASLRAEATKNN